MEFIAGLSEWGYFGLFIAAFLAGSIIPFSSEAVLGLLFFVLVAVFVAGLASLPASVGFADYPDFADLVVDLSAISAPKPDYNVSHHPSDYYEAILYMPLLPLHNLSVIGK